MEDLLRGRTTVPEGWSGGSFNHIVLTAAIDSWFYTSLAGIQIDETKPAYENILINPYIPKGLDWASAGINTIRGQVLSAWRVKNNALTLEITIPANTKATVQVPSGNCPTVKVNGHLSAKAKGVISSEIHGKDAVFGIGSGHYIFTVPYVR